MIDIKNLETLEDEINKVLEREYYEENMKATLMCIGNNLSLTIDEYDYEGSKDIIDNFCSASCKIYDNSLNIEIIKNLIDDLYRQYDKDKKVIKGYRGRIDRKINQLSKAMIENDSDKIYKINTDLVIIYKNKNKAKSRYNECREMVHVLYQVLDEISNKGRI